MIVEEWLSQVEKLVIVVVHIVTISHGLLHGPPDIVKDILFGVLVLGWVAFVGHAE